MAEYANAVNDVYEQGYDCCAGSQCEIDALRGHGVEQVNGPDIQCDGNSQHTGNTVGWPLIIAPLQGMPPQDDGTEQGDQAGCRK